MSRRAKSIALLSMLAAGTASIVFAMESTIPRLATGILLAIGMAVVLSIKTCPDCEPDTSAQKPTADA